MLKKALLALFAPILGMFILTLGNGFYTTFTTVAMHELHISLYLIGIISSMYFLGMLVGSYYSQSLINRVGHIRAYAAFTAIIVGVVLLQGLVQNEFVWAVTRFCAGYCLAGLFIVIESWVLVGSPKTHKGTILSIYLMMYYVAQALSQLLLNFHYGSIIMSFAIIALLASVSIIPVCTTYMTAPTTDEPTMLSPKTLLQKAPLGMYGGITAGVILSIIYTMLPLFLSLENFDKSDIAWGMLAAILGGALLQIPIGKLSDHMDRRLVMIIVTVLTGLVSIYLMFFSHSFLSMIIGVFLLGGFSFTLYPLSISHTSDHLGPGAVVSALALITLCYGIGSVLGPLCVSTSIHLLGPEGTFLPILIICIGLTTYTVYRIFKNQNPHETLRSIFKMTTNISSPLVPEEIAEQRETTPDKLRKAKPKKDPK